MVRAMQSVTGTGRVVAGRYELLGQIGRGAMGTVWRGRDLVLARDVAVKEVEVLGLATAAERKILQERALREARVAARLNHPGLVTVHDVIEAEDGIWIVMELVPSRSLARVLAEDGPLTPARAAELGMMLLDALGCAHAAGIVHRDVKPANVLLTTDGRAVLTDFGIATLNGDPGLTQAGMVMGTPGFCAPERIRGEPASPASDLWSLGATLYAAVEGHGPFESKDCPMAVLTHIVHADPPPAASAGPLSPAISALMCRDPAERPDLSSATRLLADAVAAGGGGVSATAPATDPTAPADATPTFEAVAVSFNAGETASAARPEARAPSGPRSATPARGSTGTQVMPMARSAPDLDAPTAAHSSTRPGPGRHRRRLIKGGDVVALFVAALAVGAAAVVAVLRQSVWLATGGAPARETGRGRRALR
jgi:Protein kinase domain